MTAPSFSLSRSSTHTPQVAIFSPRLPVTALLRAIMADGQPTTQPASEPRIAPNQNFQKQWTLHKSAGTIDKLDVAMPGLVYVSHDPTRATSVRVSSESAELLDHVAVTQNEGDGSSSSSSNCIQVRGTGTMVGHLLTEISLQHERVVHSLSTSGSATVVVEDGVLLGNNKLKQQETLSVKGSGSGDVFISSSGAFEVHATRIDRHGSGCLQFVAPAIYSTSSTLITSRGSGDVSLFVGELKSKDASWKIAGSGSANLVASILLSSSTLVSDIAGSGSLRLFSPSVEANDIESSIHGSGSVQVAAWDKLTASRMKTEIAGSGSAIVACGGTGLASFHQVNIAGSGNVHVADILADSAKINIAGSGNVAIRVATEVSEAYFGSGDVEYIGEGPHRVHTTGLRDAYKKRKGASLSLVPLAASLKSQEPIPSCIPLREAAFHQIRANQIIDVSGIKASVARIFGISQP